MQRIKRAQRMIILSALIAGLCVLLVGCGGGFDNTNCLAAVQEEFKDGQVFALPDKDYRFIVKDKDGTVWYIKTMAVDAKKITTRLIVFRQ